MPRDWVEVKLEPWWPMVVAGALEICRQDWPEVTDWGRDGRLANQIKGCMAHLAIYRLAARRWEPTLQHDGGVDFPRTKLYPAMNIRANSYPRDPWLLEPATRRGRPHAPMYVCVAVAPVLKTAWVVGTAPANRLLSTPVYETIPGSRIPLPQPAHGLRWTDLNPWRGDHDLQLLPYVEAGRGDGPTGPLPDLPHGGRSGRGAGRAGDGAVPLLPV